MSDQSSCIVVGAGPGIGASVARRFAREGLAVALIARDESRLEGLRSELDRAGHAVGAFAADAGEPASLGAAITQAIGELGPPATVVFNAVAWPPGAPLDIDPSALLSSLAVNAVAPFALAQAAAPHLAENASFLLTGGGIVLAPSAEAASLSLGKVAMRTATDLLAQAFAPRGVHVASVVVAGEVGSGGRLDPSAIADEFWRLHAQPRGDWEHEVLWR